MMILRPAHPFWFSIGCETECSVNDLARGDNCMPVVVADLITDTTGDITGEDTPFVADTVGVDQLQRFKKEAKKK